MSDTNVHDTNNNKVFNLKNLTDKKMSFELAGITLFILSAIAGALNYLFQILGGRILSVSVFGSLSAIIAVQGIFGVFGKALMTSIAVNTADLKENKLLSVILPLFKRLLPLIILFSFLSLFVIVLLDYSFVESALIIFSALVLLFEYSLYGILQRLNKMGSIGFLELLPPILKIILCLPLVYMGFGIKALPFSIVVCGVIGSVIALFLIKKRINAERNSADCAVVQKITGHYLSSLITNAVIVTLSNVDIILFEQMFGDETLGQYAAISLFGKAILYISSSLVTVMIPAIANSDNKLKTLNKTLFYTIALSLAAFVCFFIVREPVIKLLMGEKFLSGLYMFTPMFLSMFSLSVVTIMANFLLAISDKKFLSVALILSLIFLCVFPVFFLKDSPVLVLILFSIVYLMLSVIFYIRGIKISSKEVITNDK